MNASGEKPASVFARIKTLVVHTGGFLRSFFILWLWQTLTFSGLLLCYLLYALILWVLTWRIVPRRFSESSSQSLKKLYAIVVLKSTQQERTINRISLIDLAIKNMLFKKSRAFITVGGMAIGIGAIVFLVSIGFGLQELVVSRVARLDELKQADVSMQPGSKEVISDKTVATFKDFSGVSEVQPLIAIVARIEFQNSVTDMPVYGVTSNFLKQSAIQPTQGTLFDSNEVSSSVSTGRVAGVSTIATDEFAEHVTQQADNPDAELPIEFSIHEKAWIKVREKPDKKSAVMGYTRREVGGQQGYKVWGGAYPEAESMQLDTGERVYGPWIKGEFRLWEKVTCQGVAPECVEGTYKMISDSTGEQKVADAYTAVVSLSIDAELRPELSEEGSVLGESTDTEIASAAVASATDDSGWVEIASESAFAATEQITKVSLGSSAKRTAVINTAMAQVLGINPAEAVGKTFKSSFVVVGDLLNKPGEKVESIAEDYQIVAVVPDDKTPYFYVPFVDLRLLGINQYSQLKVVAQSPNELQTIRKQIETLGFTTRSVADTVKQIDRLFATARILLGILGFVALSIAALGMFNTLTVSLLERTREVGLMKAMGMRSNEVRELFLTESLVMGFFGGVFGIILGSLGGVLLSLLLSAFSVGSSVGYVDISYLPTSFVIFVFSLSLLVGVFTGVYPARRATKISALDALRYE